MYVLRYVDRVIWHAGTQPQKQRQLQGSTRQFLDFGCRVDAERSYF